MWSPFFLIVDTKSATMAGKKFTIPSLSEMESSKREEYKVKTLFDKHKKSSLSKTTDLNDTRKDVSGSNVVKATGLSTAKSVADTSAQQTLNGDRATNKAQSVMTTLGQKPQNVTQTSGKSSLLIPGKSENPQKSQSSKRCPDWTAIRREWRTLPGEYTRRDQSNSTV